MRKQDWSRLAPNLVGTQVIKQVAGQAPEMASFTGDPLDAPPEIGDDTPNKGHFTDIDADNLTDDLLVAVAKKILFRDSALSINSSADGQLDFAADTKAKVTAPTFETSAAAVIGTLLTLTKGVKGVSTAVTATPTGATTGTIPAGVSFITAGNGGDANNIVVLPDATPVVFQIVLIIVSAALELRTSSPTTIAINGGTGADAESALSAGSLVIAVQVSATAWLAFQIASDGTITGVEAAA